MRVYRIFRAGAAVALLGALAGAPGLRAQGSPSPYSYLFKIHMGLTAGDIQKTHFDNKVMGFGAEVKREMFGGGQALKCELVWEYVPGRHRDVYPWDTNPLDLHPSYSFDDRKEYGQGINLRLAYSAPLTIPYIGLDFEWFAGLGLDRFKVRSEVKYTLNFLNTNNPTRPDLGNYDGGTFVKESSQFSPGVFGGVKCKITPDFGLELSCRNFGMWHYEYTPASYSTGKLNTLYGPGTSKTGSTRGWALELALTAKL
ncbi:MAG: hypothetical protein LBC63_07785 [Holophagales bacterium]|jgi:hypothetical protein|nr:hypothetical protein [Holophagales bacterium]